MNLETMHFIFKENRFALNEFGFGVDGTLLMPGDSIEMNMTFGGRGIDMRSLLSLIPGAYQSYLDGIDAAGTVGFDGQISGLYYEEQMPDVRFGLTIDQGRVASSDAPVPIESIDLNFDLNYPSAGMQVAAMLLEFSSAIAGSTNRLNLKVNDFENYRWDLAAALGLDLEQISPLLPLDGATLTGKLDGSLRTAGRYSNLEAGKYDEIPTSGKLNVQDFLYKGASLPQGFGINTLNATLTPAAINLENFTGNAGKTDFRLTGALENYLAFVMDDSALLVGRLSHRSRQVWTDEWMTSAEVEQVEDRPAVGDSSVSEPLEVVRIPQNIDFRFNSVINQLSYDGLDLKDFRGQIRVRNGKIELSDTRFGLLGGTFGLTGAYDSRPEQPRFDFDFTIEKLSIPSAYTAFAPVKQLIPIADKMTGDFSTNISFNGVLDSEMMPDMTKLNGAGLVRISDASVKEVKVLNSIRQVANLSKQGSNESGALATLKDVAMKTRIENGRIHVEPFPLTISGNEALISGSHGIDGSLDYGLAMKVPTGSAGVAVNQALASFIGGQTVVGEYVDLNLGIQGTYDDPSVKLLGARPDGKGGLKASLSDQVNAKKEEVVTKAKETVDSVATAVVDSAKVRAEAELEKQKEAAKKKAEEEAKKAVNKLFKRK